MNVEAIRLLEFPTIKRMLAGFTTTGPGSQLALELEPPDDLEEVKLSLAQTAEMLEASQRDFRTPLGGVEDVREHVERAAAGGGPLEGPVLWQIAVLCETAGNVGSALDRLDGVYPTLAQIGARIPRIADLQGRVKSAIDPGGSVRDEATPRLKELRDQIRALRRRIEETLGSMVHNSSISPHLQYPNPSIHRERYVLPVNAYHKGAVNGIVHGTSDSGATIYIEPMQVVSMGNQLAEAIGGEEEEVRAILWALTRSVAHERDDLLRAQGMLALVDLLVAKANMARRYRMVRPVVSEGLTLELREARHPILLWLSEQVEGQPEARQAPDFDGVVPLDVHLGDEFRVLVVTGPNMGGKTVTLKTVGLLCLMARAGLFVPAQRAIMPLYQGIYVDIGDEQSLEQSLSTFSSHMSRVIRLLNAATGRSLVLLDELGAGTDPIEGAALAEVILNELVRRHCSAIITTHLGQLKTFADTCPEAENASVEFDSQTLRPTYRLIMGTAGASNALEIADRLGMPPALLEEARRRLDEASGGEYGRMLAQVQQATEDSEKRRSRVQWLEAEAERLKNEYESKLARIRDEEERTGADVGLKMKGDLQQLESTAAALHDEVRFSHKSVAGKVRDIRDGLRAALEKTDSLLAGREPDRPIQAQDEVYVVKVHKWGKVTRVDEGRGRAQVTVGGMQMEVDLDDLVPWGSTPR